MLISNFNFCKSEWLELVFEKRNKEYGAYYIRQHYSNIIVKAMVITFASVLAAAFLVGIAIRVKPVTEGIITVIDDPTLIVPPAPPKEQPKPKSAEAAKPAKPVNTKQYIQMVVSPVPTTIEPPKISDLEHAEVGPIDIKVPGEGGVPDPAGQGTGAGLAPGDGAGEKSSDVTLAPDVMPEPIGGAAAWAKFLQNNLRYPAEALEKEMGGRVFVSFVVEKDGHLSNIVVERGIGYGMDQEAARVLKLAKPWKPGLQAGRPVRVKYTLPVVFSVSY